MGQPTNEMATEQALMALSAYERFTQGQDRLYRISAIQLVETPQLGIEKFVDVLHGLQLLYMLPMKESW